MLQEKIQKDKKDKETKSDVWKGPGGGASSFYTTWSFYAIVAATCFTIITSIIFTFSPNLTKNEFFTTLCLAIMIGFAVNSIAVAVTSQFLLNLSWKPVKSKCRKATDERWIKKLNKINATVHLVPVILALFILTMTINMKWNGDKTILYFASAIVPILYFTIWLCIPVPKNKGSEEMTDFTNKVVYVYNYPSTWIMGLMPVTVALATFMFVLAKK